jgi:hypothetical protein
MKKEDMYIEINTYYESAEYVEDDMVVISSILKDDREVEQITIQGETYKVDGSYTQDEMSNAEGSYTKKKTGTKVYVSWVNDEDREAFGEY